MKKRILCLGTTLFTALILAGPVQAQETETTKLGPVVVTAGRIVEKAKNVTQSTTIIQREEIAKHQYKDIGGILRNYGVQVDNYAANSSLSQISIRGIRSSTMGMDLQSPILLLVDGRRVGTSNIAMIPMVNVERIEIIRGPASVQYGTSAIGGVVNVITRRGTEATNVTLEAGGGSWDTYKTLGEFSTAAKVVDFSGGASYLTSHNYRTGNNDKYHNSGTDYDVAYSGNLGINFNPKNRLGFTMIGVQADKIGSPDELAYNNHTAYNDRANNSMDFAYDGGYKDAGLSWKGRYFVGKDKYFNADPNDPFAHFASETEYSGVQGQLSWQKSILTLTGGADYLDYDTSTRPTKLNNKYYNTGVFGLAKLAFFDESVILSGGLRYDDYKLTFDDKEDTIDHTTPSVGLAWHTTDWLTLRSNYGESYRIPQAQELLGFDNGWTNYVGNPDLKPEEGKSWDAGFEVNYDSLNLGLTYFRTNYKNKIATRQAGAGWDQQYYNMDGTVKFRGIEAQASYELDGAFGWDFVLRPYVNLTHLFKYDDKDGEKVPNVSNMDLAYGLNFEKPDIGLDVDLRFTYYGHRHEKTYGRDFPWPTTDVKTGGDTIVDLFVTKTLYEWEEGDKVSIKGEVRNLFDVNYATIVNYPEPGQSFYIGLRYDY